MNARSEWLAARQTGIGGSDVAAILGLSKWRTPLSVYLEKRGESAPQDDNESMLWGRVLEPVIRQQYADRTGRAVRVPSELIRSAARPWMIANLDGMTDCGRVVEIKTARTSMGWGDPGTDEIPNDYLLQVQHYMAVTGFPVCDVAVLIGGSDFRMYEVPADLELHDMLAQAEAQFWETVQRGEPPAPVSYADVQAMFGRASKSATVEASNDALSALERIRKASEAVKLLEEDIERDKALVMAELGESDTLVSGGSTVATWRAASAPRRFDSKSFKAAHPDIYAQLETTGTPSRRFLIK